MLLEFSVTNFRSIKEKQTLSMVASSDKELLDSNTFETGLTGSPRALRSTAVYGANASGKSNLIMAIGFMKRFVLHSAKETQAGEKIEVKPFLLSPQTSKESSIFEIQFIQENIRYQYGFAVNNIQVSHEWLVAYPEGKPQRWFERHYDFDSQKENWGFGSKFKSHQKFLQAATRKNALFLSAAIQLNNEQLNPVFNWFQKSLFTLSSEPDMSPAFTARLCESNTEKDRLMKFMQAADLNIQDIELKKKKFTEAELPDDMPKAIKTKFVDKEFFTIKFLHKSSDDQASVFLDFFEDESEGTQKFFALAGPLLDVLSKGRVLFIDKLNNSLHPLMVRFLIRLMHNPQFNRSNAQMVFTTHDTTLLDKELFRRDQIWFMEKDKINATKLYPLSDFSPRKDEALARGYLKGRYGALPYLGELNF